MYVHGLVMGGKRLFLVVVAARLDKINMMNSINSLGISVKTHSSKN